MYLKGFPISVLFFLFPLLMCAQAPDELIIHQGVLTQIKNGNQTEEVDVPLFSLRSGNELLNSKDTASFFWELISKDLYAGSFRIKIRISNNGKDTLRLHNLVPFGEQKNLIHITGLGDHRLSRTHLFIPGKKPVNVIVPDNAWELGWGMIQLNNMQAVYGLARRDVSSIKNGNRRRFETELFPGGSVDYWIYYELFSGDWRNGLIHCFRDRKLYDAELFDERM